MSKIKIKNNLVVIHVNILEILIITGRGRRRVISTSKIKKITAIKKNRSENGSRADPLGSNPHSKGVAFSRSRMVFFDRIEAIVITIILIIRVSEMISERVMITFSEGIQSFWLEAKYTYLY